MPILTCIFFTFNSLTLTYEMHFVKFRPEVAFCLLSRGKRKYAPLGMRLLWKYIRNYFLLYHLISPFLLYIHLQNYKEFEAEISDLQSGNCGLSFDIKTYTTSGWALGDENVIGIGAFKFYSPLQTTNSLFSRFYIHELWISGIPFPSSKHVLIPWLQGFKHCLTSNCWFFSSLLPLV